MANYNTIAEAVNADTTNMTVLRNHIKNDDDATEYSTGIDWFKYNNAVVSKIYSCGNSWIGFGDNDDHLEVNRRDCAVWDEYSETGTIANNRFFKFKWCGVSYYSADPTDVDYKQWYDIFLLDNGQIYLYFYNVPISSCNGDNELNCGNSSVSFTVTAGTPCEYTFKTPDTSGTSWVVVSGKPTIDPVPEPKPTPAVVYNFLPGKYRAFVRTTYVNGLNETKTATSNVVEFSNNIPVITDAFMGTGATWDGSEVEIAWSGDYNSLTVQISNSHIVFKMYMGSTLIYTFTSPIGTSTTDIDKIHVGFLIDDENEVAKPSFIYDNGNDTYQYNQEAPTDAEMGLIYEWLGGEGGSGVYDFNYTGAIQTFTAPKTGIYQLETWGAQGENATDGTLTARGGYGAYATGEVSLTQGDTLYINVGGQNGYGGGGLKIWDGSEIDILWSGENNKLTAQIDNSTIIFKMYTSNAEIYSFTSQIGTSASDTYKIDIGFLIDNTNQVAKPSFLYDVGSSSYKYNQEEPTDAEMALIYTWLSAGLPSA